MENFVYETPTKVYFGKGEEQNVGKIIAGFTPKKVLVHFGGQSAKKADCWTAWKKRWKQKASLMWNLAV